MVVTEQRRAVAADEIENSGAVVVGARRRGAVAQRRIEQENVTLGGSVRHIQVEGAQQPRLFGPRVACERALCSRPTRLYSPGVCGIHELRCVRSILATMWSITSRAVMS